VVPPDAIFQVLDWLGVPEQAIANSSTPSHCRDTRMSSYTIRCSIQVPAGIRE